MAISIDFKKKYEHLIPKDVLPCRVELIDGDSDIPMVACNTQKKYKREFIHPKNGFVEKYCKSYDKPKMLIRTKKNSNTIIK